MTPDPQGVWGKCAFCRDKVEKCREKKYIHMLRVLDLSDSGDKKLYKPSSTHILYVGHCGPGLKCAGGE